MMDSGRRTATRSASPETVTVHVPFRFRRRGGRKAMVMLNDDLRPSPKRFENSLMLALARAYRWQSSIDSGDYASIEEIATAEGITASYVGRILRLCRLCPDQVEGILDGRSGDLSLKPVSLSAIPIGWERPS